MKKDYVIKILFVESSLEEAEQIISLLRNTGIAVRPARATNVEQMQAAVNELEPDVVMFDPAITSISMEEATKVLDAYGRDYSLLGLVNSIDNQVVAELFVQGARGVAVAQSAEAAGRGAAARVRFVADASPGAPPGNRAARVGAPLRRAARLLHRCHRLRA